MKKAFKIILIEILIVLIGIIALLFLNKTKKGSVQIKQSKIFAGLENEQSNENEYSVSSWQELKEVIENTEKLNMKINLIAETNSWYANSTITIPERKKCFNNS